MSYWIKLYTEMLHDPKFRRLSDHLRLLFYDTLLLAGEKEQDGILPDLGDAAWVLQVTEEQLQDDWRALERSGLLRETQDGWLVVNFAKRQAPSEVTQRVRLHRERKSLLQSYSNVSETFPVTGVTTPDTESESDTESDTESELREERGAAHEFTRVQTWVETATGMPAMPKDVDALRELASMSDLLEQDIIGAVAWHRDQGRVVHGAAQLLGSVKYNRGKRIQAGARASPSNGRGKRESIFDRERARIAAEEAAHHGE